MDRRSPSCACMTSRRATAQLVNDRLHERLMHVRGVPERDDLLGAVAARGQAVLLGSPRLSARDGLHVALMQQHEISRILSFDTGFDQVAGIQRIAAA